MALKLVSAPAAEPVSLTDMKTHMRVDGSAEDTVIGYYIAAVRKLCEEFTGRAFITQTWDLYLDCFPSADRAGDWWNGVREGPITRLDHGLREIEIPKPPLSSVTYLKTFDDADAEYTFDSDNYIVDNQSEPGRLALRDSSSWPSTDLRAINGIQLRFVAGFGAAGSDVPELIREAIRQGVTFFYENRGETMNKLPPAIQNVLMPYRIERAR